MEPTMPASPYRSLMPRERALLDCLLFPDFAGKDQLASQVAQCLVRELDDDGSLGFLVDPGAPMDASLCESRIPTEAEYEDSDGVTVHFLLYVVDGVIRELEVYREDNARTAEWPPDPSLLRVFTPG